MPIANFNHLFVDHIMRKHYLCFFLLLILTEAYPIYFKHLSVKEGLPQVAVMGIYQDKLDRMWFGTLGGVGMYDGDVMLSYQPTKNSSTIQASIKNETYPIIGDTIGNIYFRSDNALIKYDIYTDKFSELIEKHVRTLSSHNGDILLALSDSICLLDPLTEKAKLLFKMPNKTESIQKITVDTKQQYWIGTSKALWLKEANKEPRKVIDREDIVEITEDKMKNLWVGTRMNGLFKITKSGDTIRYKANENLKNCISSNQIRTIIEDRSGLIWIGTFTGLNCYDPLTDKFTNITSNTLPGSLTHSSVFSLLQDKQGSIWVGTYYGGVNYFNPDVDVINHYSHDNTRKDCLSFPYVGHMVEGDDGQIWICTEGGGLNQLDRKSKTFKHFTSNQTQTSIAHNNLKSISYCNERKKLYLGTHTGGLSIYDTQTNKFKNLYAVDPTYAALAGDVVIQSKRLNKDSLLVLTRNGLFNLALDTEKLTTLFPTLNLSTTGRDFIIDSKKNIWITKGATVLRINLYDTDDHSLFRINQNGLGAFDVTHVFEDNTGKIYFTTLGAGLFEYNEEENFFIGYTAEENLLISNFCYAIKQSHQGFLVILTDKGVTFLNPKTKESRFIDIATALPISGIDAGNGLLICEDGAIFVGGVDGLSSFYEDKLFMPAKPYNLYFSALRINGELVKPNDSHHILNVTLPFTKQIQLKHTQKNLRLSFSSTNYTTTLQQIFYEYKLEGFDQRWLKLEGSHIDYTNLEPGKYKLFIRERKVHTLSTFDPITLDILIATPFYATSGAYLSYFLLLTALLYAFFHFKKSRLLLQTSLEVERKEKKQITALNQAKLQFFSNISHEFRTPLTLISAQLEMLLVQTTIPASVYNKLLKIYKNTNHLQTLITELLDFRKLEEGKVTLHVAEHNLTFFIKEVFLSFQDYASMHQVDYTISVPPQPINCWFDEKQMHKVLNNLLSNAFKYTKGKGKIELSLHESEDEILIQVVDNGIGISKKELARIFDCFYQGENSISNVLNMPSTGIGLALTKNIIDLHLGNITVKSSTEGSTSTGSVFTVHLRKGNNHFPLGSLNTSEKRASTPLITYNPLPEMNAQENISHPLETFSTRPTLLLVEDNEELLQLLHDLFAPTYRIILARNGKEGIELAFEEKPDLIVSDIMMPEISGTELCVRVKSEFTLSHIPLLLLTALSSDAQSIEGLNYGADDYVTKPFNASVLLARCNTLVRNRINLHKRFSRGDTQDIETLVSNPTDKLFLEKVNIIIESNISSDTFDMNLLAKELGVSRSSLYAKFKALTGNTPNEFVQTYKLNKAANFLRTRPDLQLNEIADLLGFTSGRYLSRCFKAQFDVAPAVYKKQINEDKG